MSKREPVVAICLECWREDKSIIRHYPVGYYDVPCMRHGKNVLPNEPIRLITETDINDRHC